VTVPRLGDPGGFALGEAVVDALEVVGITQTAWRWRYNPGEVRPGGSYPPHRELAGAYLAQLPSDDGFYPGDHQGCRCSAVPVLRHAATGQFAAEVQPVEEDLTYA